MIGRALSHYEIVEKIGAGGMGEVYAARDIQLGRDVAIKVLPAELASDPERIARFEREAKALAQLNEPGIATIHGFESHEAVRFLVMELVEGETLAERIARGPISWEEAEAIFTQIADALEAAHERGILHRDLKPANIKITPAGRVKLLDFGLAKVLQDDPEIDSSLSPTRTKGTALGAILGTASYMSPEQARGQTLDRRTDIWAFGCCLYEALTGRKAFDGDTVSDILAAVLTKELDGAALDHVPRARVTVERCLEKDPKRRLRDIGDAWLVREERAHRSKRSRRSFAGALGLVAIGAAAGALAVWLASGSDTTVPEVRRTVVTLPPEAPISRASGANGRVAIAPDGERIAYVADAAGTLQIYVRSLDRLEPTPVAGTEGAVAVFFLATQRRDCVRRRRRAQTGAARRRRTARHLQRRGERAFRRRGVDGGRHDPVQHARRDSSGAGVRG